MATAIATIADAQAPATQSAEAERFNLMQRQARMFAMSPLIPEALRKGSPEQAMANCYIAMSIADRMGEDRMTVMQNIHIIHGTAGFKSSYMIARANASGKFSDEIEWEESGDGATLSLTAFATLAKSGRRVEMTVDMAMAKAEGWTTNKKYQTMPKVMLRYRSAAFLIRLYAPEVMLGHQTSEEIEDVRYAALPVAQPLTAAALLGHDPETGEVDAADDAQFEPEQGRTDEQHGDQHDGTDAEHPARCIADDLIARIERAELLSDVANAEAVLAGHEAAMPDALVAEVRAVAEKRRNAIKGAA